MKICNCTNVQQTHFAHQHCRLPTFPVSDHYFTLTMKACVWSELGILSFWNGKIPTDKRKENELLVWQGLIWLWLQVEHWKLKLWRNSRVPTEVTLFDSFGQEGLVLYRALWKALLVNVLCQKIITVGSKISK